MSIAALTEGFPGRTLSILSATSRGRSNAKPSKARAIARPFGFWIEPAERRERALRPSRPDRSTQILPEPDEQFVDVEPVLLRHGPHEAPLRRFRRLRPHEAEPIADPVDVGVRRDARHAEP